MFRVKSLVTLFGMIIMMSEVGLSQIKIGDRAVPAGTTNGSSTVSTVSDYSAVRMTNDGAESTNPRLAVDGSYLYLAWEDTRDGNREIYWQKFIRATGSPVTSPIRLTNTSASSIEPSIGIDGSGNSYVVWQEGTLYGTIMGTKIDPSGNVLVSPLALSPNLCLHADISTQASGVSWVVFERRSASDQDVYMRQFNSSLTLTCDKHTNWGSLPAMDKAPVVVASSDGQANVYWRDMDMWWQDGIYYVQAPANCGNLGGRLEAGGGYAWPGVGYSGVWAWAITSVSGNVYNLYNDNSVFQVNDVSGKAGIARVADDPNYGYCVWADTRDGHSEIYLSKAYTNTSFPDERLTNFSSSKGRPDIASHTSEAGKWWVVWPDNRDGNWEIYMTTSTPSIASLKILDGSTVPQPVRNQLCKIYKIEANNSETWTADVTTNDQGVAVLPEGTLVPGDRFKVELLVHTQPAKKAYHGIVDDVAHRMYIDNAEVQANGPLRYNDNYSGVPEQTVVLNHTVIKFNLLVVLEWDASDEVLSNLELAFKKVANYMFDVTDGQATLDQVMIYDCGNHPSHLGLWNAADVQIHAVNTITVNSSPGYRGNQDGCDHGVLNLPRVVYSNDVNANPDLVQELGIDWTIPQTTWCFIWCFHWYDPGIQAIAHELGHYLFYFGDEYVDSYQGDPNSCKGQAPNHNFALMDEPLNDQRTDPQYGEMSADVDYSSLGLPPYYTHQWCMWQKSCWNAFRSTFEGTGTDRPFGFCWEGQLSAGVNIVTPEERSPSGLPLLGPNNDLDYPDIDCGAAARITYWDMTDNGGDVLIYTPKFAKANAPIGASVLLQKSALGNILNEGNVASDGRITVVGANPGDTVRMYALRYDSTSGSHRYFAAKSVIGSLDSMEMPLIESSTAYPMAIQVVATGQEQFKVTANCPNPFASSPSLSVYAMGEDVHTEVLSVADGVYTSSENIASGRSGVAFVNGLGAQSQQLEVAVDYSWTSVEGPASVTQASSRDGRCRVHFDGTIGASTAVVVGSYSYPFISNGIAENARAASPCFSISAFPTASVLTGNNYLSIRYFESSSSALGADTLLIYRWNASLGEWQPIPSTTDTTAKITWSSISSDGLYILMKVYPSCCVGKRGNVNCTGAIDLGDLSALVSYLTGGGFVLCCKDAADINGDGVVDLRDLSSEVSFLTGGGFVLPNCP